jgi:hypothetical protein
LVTSSSCARIAKKRTRSREASSASFEASYWSESWSAPEKIVR